MMRPANPILTTAVGLLAGTIIIGAIVTVLAYPAGLLVALAACIALAWLSR